MYTRQKTGPFFSFLRGEPTEAHKEAMEASEGERGKGLPKDNKVSILFVRLTALLGFKRKSVEGEKMLRKYLGSLTGSFLVSQSRCKKKKKKKKKKKRKKKKEKKKENRPITILH